jgi:hypothetical protein
VLKPRFIVAATCGLASYAMMNLLMTSAPLAMVMCNHQSYRFGTHLVAV